MGNTKYTKSEFRAKVREALSRGASNGIEIAEYLELSECRFYTLAGKYHVDYPRGSGKSRVVGDETNRIHLAVSGRFSLTELGQAFINCFTGKGMSRKAVYDYLVRHGLIDEFRRARRRVLESLE